MPSKAVALVVISFLTVVLISGLASTSYLDARIKSDIHCTTGSGIGYKNVMCCQVIDGTKWCTVCDNTVPPSNCDPRFKGREAPVNTTGVVNPLGNATIAPGTPPPVSIIKAPPGPNAPTTNNNTGTPPVSIIKAPPGKVNPAGNVTNPNNTASKSGVYSPTGGCSTSSKSECIPCDPGLPTPYCIPSSDWPLGVRTAVNAGVFNPPGNATNAPPTGSNTGTPSPTPPKGQVGPGCGPGTDNSTCSTSTPNPQPIQKGSNQGASTSNGNSTGH